MQILRPFSPPIYNGIISDDFYALIKIISDQSLEAEEKPKGLVGNLKNQYQLIYTDEQKYQFLQHLEPHFNFFISNCEVNNNQPKETTTLDWGDNIWINFQGPGDFQPLHIHSGLHSIVIYVDVPREIEKENEEMAKWSIKPCAGHIHLVDGGPMVTNNQYYVNDFNFLPENKQILIFPADTKHMVYPFKSDVVRTSISFNITSLGTRNL